MTVRGGLLLAAGVVAVAAAGALWWPVTELHNAARASDAPLAVPPAASAAQVLAAWRLAAARVCADGCEAPLPAADGGRSEPHVTTVALAPLPVDLDAWLLNPDAMPIEAEPSVIARLHNIPDAPDEHDPTPADESDPDAPPVDAPAGE